MTISSVLPAGSYQQSTPAAGTGATPVVAKTSDASLAQTAVTLSADAGIVAALGASTSGAPTYNAAGLLNALVQAGHPSASSSQASTTTAPQTAQQNQDQAIAGSLPSSPATSGIYNPSGVLQTTPSTDVTANWASILKTNPERRFPGLSFSDS